MPSDISRTVVPEDLDLDVTVLSEGRFCSLLFAESIDIYVHVRFGNACETPADIDAFVEELKAVSALPGHNHRLIADVRRVKGNNHPDFEAKVFPIVMGFSKSFSRFVAVTESVAGALQMQRAARHAGYIFRATNSMREAVELASADDGEASTAYRRPVFPTS